MPEETFAQDFNEMLEVDSGLDINDMLNSIPAIEPEKKETTDKTVEKTEDKDELSLDNINRVLEKEVKETETKPEEKVVEKEIEDKTPASNEKTTEKSSDAPFTVIFARDLVAQGLLSSFDEEEFAKQTEELGEADALRNLIKTEITTNIEAAKSDLDAGYQEYLSLIGKGVQQETASSLIDLKSKFDAIKSDELIKEDNLELRKQVMTDYFRLTTSMTDAKIEKIVQGSIDMGDDIEDSKEYHETLKTLVTSQINNEKAEADKRNALQLEENKRSVELLKENINSLSEIITGVPINKQTKNQMFEAITKPVEDSQGRVTNALWAKRSEDPMFFDERLSYLYATGFFEKEKTWSKATQSKVTTQISELEKALEKNKNTQSSSGISTIQNQQIDKTSKDNIESMRGIFG